MTATAPLIRAGSLFVAALPAGLAHRSSCFGGRSALEAAALSSYSFGAASSHLSSNVGPSFGQPCRSTIDDARTAAGAASQLVAAPASGRAQNQRAAAACNKDLLFRPCTRPAHAMHAPSLSWKVTGGPASAFHVAGMGSMLGTPGAMMLSSGGRPLSTIPHTDVDTNQSHRQAPPITPRAFDESPGEVEASDGRSSQTCSVQTAVDPDTVALVHDVFSIYEAKDPEVQQRLLQDRYTEDCVYEGSAIKLVGRASIAQAFASLARMADKVHVKYEAPVILGATGRIDGVVGDYSDKPNLKIEVQNVQTYHLGEAASLPSQLMDLPKELILEGVTALTLDPSGQRVLLHEDRWTDVSSHGVLFKRMVGVLMQTVGAAQGAVDGGK